MEPFRLVPRSKFCMPPTALQPFYALRSLIDTPYTGRIPKITDKIIDYLYRDKRSLLACALVCRQRLDRSRFILCSQRIFLDRKRIPTTLDGINRAGLRLELQNLDPGAPLKMD
ncbi:unnamed protein product [Somion occarium]|uniref:Uncharacterized protein n=1 Tax=Somion occarium TaxID=3059160 RepID=A0ABP1CHF1_9APHY